MPEKQVDRFANFTRYSLGMLGGALLTLAASGYVEDKSHLNSYEQMSVESSTNNLQFLETRFTEADEKLFNNFKTYYGRPDWKAGAEAQKNGADISSVERAYKSFAHIKQIKDDNEFQSGVADFLQVAAGSLGIVAGLGFVAYDNRCAIERFKLRRLLKAPAASLKMRTLRTGFTDIEPDDIIYSSTSIEDE